MEALALVLRRQRREGEGDSGVSNSEVCQGKDFHIYMYQNSHSFVL
jgi:hypothetical protein